MATKKKSKQRQGGEKKRQKLRKTENRKRKKNLRNTNVAEGNIYKH